MITEETRAQLKKEELDRLNHWGSSEEWWCCRIAEERAARREAEQKLEYAHTKLGWPDGPHLIPTDCPTYYDGCHCLVETLVHNIERAQKAEARLKDYEEDRRKIINQECAADERHCACVPDLRDEAANQKNRAAELAADLKLMKRGWSELFEKNRALELSQQDWHNVADSRSAEIIRLDTELKRVLNCACIGCLDASGLPELHTCKDGWIKDRLERAEADRDSYRCMFGETCGCGVAVLTGELSATSCANGCINCETGRLQEELEHIKSLKKSSEEDFE